VKKTIWGSLLAKKEYLKTAVVEWTGLMRKGLPGKRKIFCDNANPQWVLSVDMIGFSKDMDLKRGEISICAPLFLYIELFSLTVRCQVMTFC
jgi:hypothetical protein